MVQMQDMARRRGPFVCNTLAFIFRWIFSISWLWLVSEIGLILSGRCLVALAPCCTIMCDQHTFFRLQNTWNQRPDDRLPTFPHQFIGRVDVTLPTHSMMRIFLATAPFWLCPTAVTPAFLFPKGSLVSTSHIATSSSDLNAEVTILEDRRHVLHKCTGGILSLLFIGEVSFPSPARSKINPALQDARDQLDLVVQACSVQAWTDAYDLVTDSSLDGLDLTKEISTGIQTLRERLKGVTELPTKDAVDVMSVGTQTRSALDKYLAHSSSS